MGPNFYQQGWSSCTKVVVVFFFNLRAKRGGSLFETGSEREEHGGVPSAQNVAVQKWQKAWSLSDEIRTEGPSVQDAGTYSWVSRSCARSARNCARSALKHSFQTKVAEGLVGE